MHGVASVRQTHRQESLMGRLIIRMAWFAVKMLFLQCDVDVVMWLE